MLVKPFEVVEFGRRFLQDLHLSKECRPFHLVVVAAGLGVEELEVRLRLKGCAANAAGECLALDFE